MIHLRNQTPALNSGSLEVADDLCNGKIFAYFRIADDKKYLMLLNMSNSRVKNPAIKGDMLLSTHTSTEENALQPFEGRVIICK